MIPAVYLLAVVVFGFAATLLRLPPLVGFLTAGFVLGSSPLPNLEFVEVLGDLGVAVLLFTIGLKLDLRVLRRKEVVGTAVIVMTVLSVLSGAVVAALLALGLNLGATTPGGIAAVGFALSFSSTVVVVKLLEDRDDAGSLYGRIGIGVLVLQDIAAVAYMTIVSGRLPSPWAATLVLLWPASRLFGKVLDRIDHREMRALFGMSMALLPGYLLFDLVGVDGDLGALVMGALLASHPAAKELSSALFTIKELLLVGFFLAIGLDGVPGTAAFAFAGALLLLLPVRSVIYTLVVRRLGMRRRTSVLTGLALTAYSEFALIVVGTAADHGLLGAQWPAAVSLALALSFVVSAMVNHKPASLVQWMSERLPRRAISTLHPDEQPLRLDGVCTVVFGMGRAGRSTYTRLYADGESGVLGIDNDATKVEELTRQGFNVLEADATDQQFWERLEAVHVSTVVLAMSEPGANVHVLDWLDRSHFDGRVLAIARYDDEAATMRAAGVDVVINLYEGAGEALARAAESLDPGPSAASGAAGH
ncbi:cation:proton antiporter family protein [Actinomyces ruminis]|uniref:Transporter n=1 Tax=Actinomyces ruminis TaxID=1937003 RepID=A0ABX4M9F3_9ACTO|nr:cation:proton antiporter family protein [Actinomyces ruminis]PHP52093.1 transporter [Actinomyces ruminis]